MTVINPSQRAIKDYPGDDRWLFWDNSVFRPYTDTAEALATVVSSRRHKGLFAVVGNALYWYKDGITDADLVPFIDAGGVIQPYSSTAAFPATGNDQKIYKANDTGYLYTWNGASYDRIAGVNWGDVGGTLSDQTDLQNALDAKLEASAYNDRFKGKYTTLSALTTAHPTANAGDYAQVDAGAGSDVVNYNYDAEDGWIEGGSGSAATTTDELPEGSTNFYFTNARARAAFSGTTNRISLASGVIDISPSYTGQNSITTVGIITNGTWAGTAIASVYGGTGFAGYAKGDLIYASAANTLSKLSAGTNGYVLTLAAGIPTWAAGVSFPSQTGNAGKFLKTDGTSTSWAAVSGWSTTGNAATDPATNFLGTTDAQPFVFKTNNTKAFQVNADQTTTFYNKLTVYDNTYNFIDFRRNSPNDISIFKIYATGDFSTLYMTLGSDTFLSYTRSAVANLSILGAPTGLQDNSSVATTSTMIVKNLALYQPTSAGIPTLDFWNDYSLQCRRAQIISSHTTGRAGYLGLCVNTGADATSTTTEAMRIMPSLNVLIGTTTDVNSSILTLSSTTKGFLPTRMTTAQRDLIPTPAEGLEIYNLTTHKKNFFNGTAWEQVTSA